MLFRILVLFMAMSGSAVAQDQGAGKINRDDASKLFDNLSKSCSDTDILVLRARTRVEQGRTTEEAAQLSLKLVEDALRLCSSGEITNAKATMQKAYQTAKDGVGERFDKADVAKLNIPEKTRVIWSGAGFSQVVDEQLRSTKNGKLLVRKTNDFWHWSIAPDEFPTAISANCTYQILLNNMDRPTHADMMCYAQDGDGDVALIPGTIDATGSGTWYLSQGSGKYAKFDGKGTFEVVLQLSDKKAYYEFFGTASPK